jgi:pyruvate dehydrogenase E1 component beta subunit
MEQLVPLTEQIGRVVVIHEASQSGGVGAEVATRLTQEAFFCLEAPVIRVTGFDTPYPPSKLEHWWLPNVDRVIEAVEQVLDY